MLLHELPNADHRSGLAYLRRMLISGDVVARFFDTSRLERVLSSGTDRDDSSVVWEASDDYDHAQDLVSMPASAILYGFTLRVDSHGLARVDFAGRLTNYNLDFLTNSYHEMLALYDPGYLTRMSESEYWFSGDKKAALRSILSWPNKKI